jgi:hypothetical protein
MISLIFIVLEKTPIITNGYLHEKQSISNDKLHTRLEKLILKICQDLSDIKQIGFNDNLLSIGVDSIHINQVNTIAEHAKLLETIKKDDIQSKQWHTLHIDEGETVCLQPNKICFV